MTQDDLLKDKRERILRLCAEHGARSVRVFGSVARGQADQQSDVDFLVELEPGRALNPATTSWRQETVFDTTW